MLVKSFELPAHNSHYEGAHDANELKWRSVCAIDKANNIQALLGSRQIASILEVGCGTGAVLAEVARRGIGTTHVGIDVTDPSAHTDPDALELQLLKYDGVVIPFPDASFDLVFASHVIEHVPNPRGLLSELLRVARRFIYIEVPCELNFRTTHRAMQTSANIGHINAYTPESFLLLLQTAGVDMIDLNIFDHSLDVHRFRTSAIKGWSKMVIRRSVLRISPRLAFRLFTYHCGALGRR